MISPEFAIRRADGKYLGPNRWTRLSTKARRYADRSSATAAASLHAAHVVEVDPIARRGRRWAHPTENLSVRIPLEHAVALRSAAHASETTVNAILASLVAVWISDRESASDGRSVG